MNVPEQRTSKTGRVREQLTYSQNLSPFVKYMNSDSSLSTSTKESPDLFIELIQVERIRKSSAWFADISTSGGKLTFKLDTGAEVSVLPRQIYDKLESKLQLKSKLTACSGLSIIPSGTCKLTCNNQNNASTCEVNFYVAPVNAHPILGFGDCVELGLVKWVYTMHQEGLTKDKLKQSIQRSWDTWKIPHHFAR